MTIEQKSELNRFVDPTIPLTWEYRWAQLKFMLPAWLLVLAFFVEILLFGTWLTGRFWLQLLLVALGGWLAMILFVAGMMEIQIRARQRSKRVILFNEKGITVKPAKNPFVRWKQILKFQLEPIPEVPGTTALMLYLRARPGRKQTQRAFWAMVLENPSQTQDLARYLQTRKSETPTCYEIEILESPGPAEQKSPAPYLFLGMTLIMGGYFLLIHGGPMLLAILDRDHHDSGDGQKLSPEAAARIQHFIHRHFASKEEFRHFFLTLGIILIVSGVALMILGKWLTHYRPAGKSVGTRSGAG
ncbi:MAG TPA: hypothetical protein VFC17_00295 [Candidatus Limnocylindrales bacterium]|nr:hypothetical protein [Candidatus Limnocylindrales bacterium]